MAEAGRPLPLIWETRVECLAPSSGLAHCSCCGHLGGKPVDSISTSLSLSLCVILSLCVSLPASQINPNNSHAFSNTAKQRSPVLLCLVLQCELCTRRVSGAPWVFVFTPNLRADGAEWGSLSCPR